MDKSQCNLSYSDFESNTNFISNDSLSSKPTETRIEFVNKILGESKLIPMINLDNCDTEIAINPKLQKKIIDIRKFLLSTNCKLKYIKSGSTGHTFKAVSKKNKNLAFAVKVCAYPRNDGYGSIHDSGRPENVELRIMKLLSYFVINRKSPHFVLPITTFNTSISNFVSIPQNIIDLNDKKNSTYRNFIIEYNKGTFENLVSVLVNEWCSGGDLLDYIRKNYEKITLKDWTVIFFQLLFSLALVHQKYPTFRHNDMKANNILVELTNVNNNDPMKRYCYKIDNVKFIIPNINVQIKIWDFDFACIDGLIDNNKVNSDWPIRSNITSKKNRYYDIHYFFNTLMNPKFFPQLYKGGAPEEIINFFHRIVPEQFRMGGKYINQKGRIMIDTEYTSPYKIIMNDPLFEKYRFRNKSY